MSSITSSDKGLRRQRVQMLDMLASDPLARLFLPYGTPYFKKPKNKTHEQEPEYRGIMRPSVKNTKDFILSAEKIIDYTFKDADILEEALEAPGSGWRLIGSRKKMVKEGNARLASIGEDVLRLVVGEYCYKIGLNLEETGQEVTKVLSKQNLDFVGRESKLERYVRLGRRTGAFSIFGPGILGDRAAKLTISTIKAVLGAVYHDGGLDAVKKTVVALKICEELCIGGE